MSSLLHISIFSVVLVVSEHISTLKTKIECNPLLKEISNTTTLRALSNDLKETKTISQEHIPTFLELKKKIEQGSAPKEDIELNSGKQILNISTFDILSDSDLSNPHSTSDDYSKKSHSCIQSEKNQKHKRLKKKRRKCQTEIYKDESSASDSSYVQSRRKHYVRRIPKQSIENDKYEEARASVLASSSGDDCHIDNQTTYLESSCEHSFEKSLDISNGDNHQRSSGNREYNYSTIPDAHCYQIDLAKDEKLIKRAYVKIPRLSEKVTDKLEICRTDIRVSKDQISFHYSDTKLHNKTHNSTNDGEIDHLCDLQSLNKIKPIKRQVKQTHKFVPALLNISQSVFCFDFLLYLNTCLLNPFLYVYE